MPKKTNHNDHLREIRRCLRERTPENWLLRIEMIKNLNVREKIAKIVWWDYFANKPRIKGYNNHLDKYANVQFTDTMISPDDMCNELRKIGYIWKDTIRRIKVYETIYNEHLIAKNGKKGKYG